MASAMNAKWPAQTRTSQSHWHPKEAMGCLAIHFVEPYLDSHYNLLNVTIDKRTRYPEVAKTHLTASRPRMEKLKTMFATHGMPRQLESDNGPQFNSKEFE